jgi:hypothetical protein
MRRALWLAAIAVIAAFAPSSYCQQQEPAKPSSQDSTASQSGAAQTSPQASASQQESLAEAARRAREQKKDTPKQAKVITNDNIPKESGISAVGEQPPAPADAENPPVDGVKPDKAAGTDEKKWRERFEKLRHKLEQDQADLDVMQRELGVLDLQYYNDPVKGMQQGLTRGDINEKTGKIAAKQKEVDADKQAISDAEDDLRQAGGDPGWAR